MCKAEAVKPGEPEVARDALREGTGEVGHGQVVGGSRPPICCAI
jgi:hypothetical protein